MSVSTSLPPELITRVFQACHTFSDALSLSATCEHLQTHWLAHHGNIIWEVGNKSVLSFDIALVAVSRLEYRPWSLYIPNECYLC